MKMYVDYLYHITDLYFNTFSAKRLTCTHIYNISHRFSKQYFRLFTQSISFFAIFSLHTIYIYNIFSNHLIMIIWLSSK